MLDNHPFLTLADTFIKPLYCVVHPGSPVLDCPGCREAKERAARMDALPPATTRDPEYTALDELTDDDNRRGFNGRDKTGPNR